MARAERLADLAARLSDGQAIDWDAERARSIDDEESRLVEELASIHRVIAAMRSSEAGPTVATPQESLVGLRIGPYRIERGPERGGMGEVYRARDERLGRFVAIKALQPSLATDELAHRRFLNETRLACRVSHPYVAVVHDVVQHQGRVLMVMEWVAGDTLNGLLATGPHTPARVATLAHEIAEALQAIHRAGVVHRDLKPGNVMLPPDGHVKVMDFGVALHVFTPEEELETPDSVERLTRDGRGVGTIAYMSPEQLRGRKVDARSDLFALGIILWELLTGTHPFSRGTAYETASAILNDPPGSSTEAPLLPGAPEALKPVVLRLLEKDPAKRYPDASALIADLDAVASGERVAPPPRERKGIVRLLMSLSAVALVAVAAWLLARRSPPTSPPASGRTVVAVLPFRERGSQEPGSVRGELTASLVGAGLFESGSVRPVDMERISALAVADQPDAVRRIAASTHAGFVVDGDLWDEGSTLVGTLRVYRAGSGDAEATYPIRAGGPSGFAAIAAARVLDAVASGHGSLQAGRAVTRGTTSDEAREQEFRAKAALRIADFGTAIAALEAALRLDPSFIAARTTLAEALYRAGYAKRSREEAERAVRDAASAGELPPRMALEARAVHDLVHEEPAQELDRRRELCAKYPDDPGLLLALGDVLDRAGHPDEALGVATQIEAIDPGDARGTILEGRVAANVKKFDVAEAALLKAESIAGPDGPAETRARIAMQRGQIAMIQGRYDAAETAYRNAGALFASVHARVPGARAERSALDAVMVRGDFTKLGDGYDRVLDVFRSAGATQDVVRTLSANGGRYYLAGDVRRAEPLLRAALAEGRPLDNPILIAYPQLNLAGLLIHTGRVAEARGLAEEALTAARDYHRKDPELLALSLIAETKNKQGLPMDAIADYREVASLAKAGSVRERLGFALFNEADIEEIVGAVADGIAAADEAIAELRARKQNVELAYSLAIRARLASQVADWAGVDTGLAEARKLAAAAGDAMKDQRDRIDLADAGALLRRGEWKKALAAYRAVGSRAADSPATAVAVGAMLGECQAQLELGRYADAEKSCGDADRDARALPQERAKAHALLGEALFQHGRHADAESASRRALQEAGRMELLPCAFLASSTLVGLAAPADREAAVHESRSWYDRYTAKLPPDGAARLKSRKDLEKALQRVEIAAP